MTASPRTTAETARPTHTSVVVPSGVRAPRFRPPASSAPAQDLNGEWRFRLHPEAVTGADPADAGTDWDRLAVPGHWQLAGAPDAWPYGKPAYTNVLFPIPLDPPHVPRENPTGEYRRELDVPAAWLESGRVVLRFEGVDSWFEVSVNGTPVATSHGSRLPTEVDVTAHVRAGENLLAVRVTQWSAFTYVEDQDQWWLSGIFRDVALLHRPAGAVEHVVLTAEYDHATGTGTFRADVETTDGAAARVRVPELGLDLADGEEASVAVEPWSAESPRLYEVQVSTDVETVTLQTGFRTIEIADGVFTVNGAPIKLYGVNRHEFEPTRGRAVTPETMLADVLLMKTHHVNAVRTSHYPPHPHFLDLCDRYGLYVVDENDLETHGFIAADWRDNPTDSPAWEDVLVDRVQRLVRRDAHHPSIILWSLGNEAGEGRNLGAMSAAIRALDGTRPIHYEGDWSSEHVDVYSRMYATTQETALIGRGEEDPLPDGELDARRRAMPFVQCEYVHAMGNGPGGFTDYDDLFEVHPRLMGGFVWEWIDHGIATRDENGTSYYGYGGDFGEELHDGNFIADGLLLPDRTPSPGMLEMAAVYAPVRIEAVPGVPDALEIRNRYGFRDLSHVRLAWTLHADGDVLAEGDLTDVVGPLAAGDSALVSLDTLGTDLPTASPDADLWWTVRATTTETGEHVPAELGAGQLLVRPRAALPVATGRVSTADDGGWQVGPARLDRAGRLVALGGTAVRTSRADAWRAPTDNDHAKAWAGTHDEGAWEQAGLTRLHERLDDASVETDDDGEALVVTGRLAGAATDRGFAVRYRWAADADDPAVVELTLDLVPEGRWSGSVARLGWLLGLEQHAAADVVVDWTGQGPGESYADSTKAALAGRYRHTVAELQTPYTHPQENGARRGVTRAALALAAGELELRAGEVSLGAEAVDGVELTVRPWTDQALHAAAHPHELAADGALWLHVDAGQHGLGTAACGPGVLANATLRPVPASLRVRLRVG